MLFIGFIAMSESEGCQCVKSKRGTILAAARGYGTLEQSNALQVASVPRQ